jgi:hypothetical protein
MRVQGLGFNFELLWEYFVLELTGNFIVFDPRNKSLKAWITTNQTSVNLLFCGLLASATSAHGHCGTISVQLYN